MLDLRAQYVILIAQHFTLRPTTAYSQHVKLMSQYALYLTRYAQLKAQHVQLIQDDQTGA